MYVMEGTTFQRYDILAATETLICTAYLYPHSGLSAEAIFNLTES